MEIQYKLDILTKVAEALNKENITWAVGASLLLYFKGITNTFDDIDLMVSEKDIERVNQVLSSFGVCQKRNPNLQYKTKHFLEYVIDGVEFDIMAGFIIVCDGQDYSFPLESSDIKDSIILNGTKIPLQSVAQWKTYYKLMGRTQKVQMIEKSTKETS